MSKRTYSIILTLTALFVVAFFFIAPSLEESSYMNCTDGVRSVTYCDIKPNSIWGRFGTLLISLIMYVIPLIISWATIRAIRSKVNSITVVFSPLLILGIVFGFAITGIGRAAGEDMFGYLSSTLVPLILFSLLGITFSFFPHIRMKLKSANSNVPR